MQESGELHFAASPVAEVHKGDKAAQGHEGDTMATIPEVEMEAKPQGHLKEAPLFIEACCGSAMLSACVSKLGFDVLAIDFHGNKHRPFVHVVELDLRKQSTWTFLEHLLSTFMQRLLAAQLPEREIGQLMMTITGPLL